MGYKLNYFSFGNGMKTLVGISGSFDRESVPDFWKEIFPKLRGDVVLDFSEVDRVDCCAVGTFFYLGNKMKEDGRALSVNFGDNRYVRDFFNVHYVNGDEYAN